MSLTPWEMLPWHEVAMPDCALHSGGGKHQLYLPVLEVIHSVLAFMCYLAQGTLVGFFALQGGTAQAKGMERSSPSSPPSPHLSVTPSMGNPLLPGLSNPSPKSQL